MTAFLIKRLLPALLLLATLLMLSLRGQAQQPEQARDSIGRATHIRILKYQFLIAGEYYKIQKFRLPAAEQYNADSLFMKCISDYKKIYAAIPEQKLSLYFSDSFYDIVIPVVQYFRSPVLAALFLKDQAALHPEAVVHDPKHHELHDHENTTENPHTDK